MIAQSPLQSVVASGDSMQRSRAVGHSIESALGLRWNAEKTPDYKGIELKAGRGGGNLTTLFACVPDWNLSSIQSCEQILERYGYWDDDGRWALYCTVTAARSNPQGLQLRIDKIEEQLIEFSVKQPKGDFARWLLSTLHGCLTTKHPETFWITARSEMVRGREYFQLKSVIHTRQPSTAQFDFLLEQGDVSIDHRMHYRGPGKKKLRDHGLPFRIFPGKVSELFSLPSRAYKLVED